MTLINMKLYYFSYVDMKADCKFGQSWNADKAILLLLDPMITLPFPSH